MTRMLHFVGAAALMIGLSGCVSQEKYNALKLDRDGLQEQLAQAQKDASTARAEADSYKGNLAAIMNNGQGLQGLVTNLQQQNANLQATLDDLNRRYNDAISRAGTGSPLPPQLTSDLSAFAAANPDLVDFDAARGIVKFKSDVTFAKGDATVTPAAKTAISRFAQILNTPTASGYELLIAGHTDNSPVVNPQTKAAGHRDNWYLSSHRAISVGQELISHSTNPQRIGVVGYAEMRPVAPNGSEAGKAQNRRVEVLILPTTVRGGGGVISAGARTAPTARPNLNKDSSAGVGTAPLINK